MSLTMHTNYKFPGAFSLHFQRLYFIFRYPKIDASEVTRLRQISNADILIVKPEENRPLTRS